MVRERLTSGLQRLLAIVDPHGRTVTPPARPASDPIGFMRVQDQWRTVQSVGMVPLRLAQILREADQGHILRQVELAEEIEEKSPQIATTLQVRKVALQELPWEVQPATESPEDQDIADLVRQQLTDIDLGTLVFDLADADFKGFSASELRWEIKNGKAWLTGIERIQPKRFTFSFPDLLPESPLPKLPRLLTSKSPLLGEELEPFTIVYHHSSVRSGLPTRTGLFRTLVWCYLFWNFTIKDWTVFLEKWGQPVRVGKFQQHATPHDVDILKAAVQALGTDSGVVISDSTLLEILESGGKSASGDLYGRAAQYWDSMIAKVVLGQTASTEGTPGQLGNEQERGQVRQDIKAACARSLSKTIRDQIIWPIVGWNFGWDRALPSFRFVVDEPEDLESMSLVHKNLVDMGAPIPVSYIQKKYAIPEAVGDEPVLQRQAMPGASPGSFPFSNGMPEGETGVSLLTKKKVPVGNRLVSWPSPGSGR